MSKSIIDENKVCHVCGVTQNLERHHVFFGVANRSKAETDGLWVWLCDECHRGRFGVHGHDGSDLNRSLKREGETAYLRHYEKTVEQFVRRYGKNYL